MTTEDTPSPDNEPTMVRPYRREAYVFVSQALDYTVKIVGKRRHITGRELLYGLRDFALDQFGPLARLVFESWGVYRTDDFGRIVFDLIANKKMSKTDRDSVDDFHGVYDFCEAFDDPSNLEFKIPED